MCGRKGAVDACGEGEALADKPRHGRVSDGFRVVDGRIAAQALPLVGGAVVARLQVQAGAQGVAGLVGDGLVIVEGEAVARGKRAVAGRGDDGGEAAADGIAAHGKVIHTQGGDAEALRGDGRGVLPRAVRPQGGEQGEGGIAGQARVKEEERQRQQPQRRRALPGQRDAASDGKQGEDKRCGRAQGCHV